MIALDILSRITHVLTAIVLTGGSTFILLVMLPVVGTLSAEVKESFSEAIHGRWKRFIHAGIALFLLSGFYNYVRAIPLHRGDSLWHAMLGTKMLLAFAVFFFASALVGRGRMTAGIRQSRKRWLTIVVLMSVTIVAMSGFLKVRGVPQNGTLEKADEPTSPATVSLVQ